MTPALEQRRRGALLRAGAGALALAGATRLAGRAARSATVPRPGDGGEAPDETRADHLVATWERRAFRQINARADAAERVLWVPMQLGSLWGPVAVAGAWALRGRRGPAWRSVVAGVVAWQAAKVLKGRVGRGRPHDLLDAFRHRQGTPYEGGGFVSGHAAVAFSLAAVAAPELRAWAPAGYGLASVTAAARVHVAAHLPLDVLGGAAMGYSLGWLANSTR